MHLQKSLRVAVPVPYVPLVECSRKLSTISIHPLGTGSFAVPAPRRRPSEEGHAIFIGFSVSETP